LIINHLLLFQSDTSSCERSQADGVQYAVSGLAEPCNG
jgi:hypothetical protein